MIDGDTGVIISGLFPVCLHHVSISRSVINIDIFAVSPNDEPNCFQFHYFIQETLKLFHNLLQTLCGCMKSAKRQFVNECL